MCRLFIHWVLLCLFLGLLGCGSTLPNNSGMALSKSSKKSVIEKEKTTVALNEASSKEDPEISSDAPVTVTSNMTLPQLKPSVNPSIVIGPATTDDLLANRVFEPEESQGSATTLDVIETEKTDKPYTEQNADDVINNIIWKIQAEVSNHLAQPEPKVPEGQDPSLAKDALEAAFELLAQKTKPESTTSPTPELSMKKVEGVTRIALLLPVTGFYKHMGEELRKGAELALFSAQNPKVELMVFDTMGGQRGRSAATEAVAAESDIIVGPLFSDAVAEAQLVAKTSNIPMLLLSNNSLVAARGSWLMGYLPEQQLDLLLGHAIADGKRNFGILAEDSDFGKRLALHAQRRLLQLSLPVRDSIVLKDNALESEDILKRAIKNFSRYEPPSEKELAPKKPPVFDALIFAGGAEFALRTAPVLAYYDLGSDTIMYLGNAQWNQQRILSEPSLQNGLFAFRPSNTDDQFLKKWTTIWPDRPGLLSRLSFDAVALAEVLAGKDRSSWQKDLLSSVGFNGFSGAFRFLPGGGNVRAFELRQIADGTVKLLKPAPDKI